MRSLFVIIAVFIGCTNSAKEFRTDDIEIFKNTPVWKLALSVERQDTASIRELSKKVDINYREKRFRETVLHYATAHQLLQSTEALLHFRADPNIQMYTGETPVILATKNYDSSTLLKIMLEHGGDVNSLANDTLTHDLTPLIAASARRLESVQMLVAKGANVNFISANLRNALMTASMSGRTEVVEYLLIACHARIDLYPKMKEDFLWNLRSMLFDLSSTEYRTKMRVVQYLKNQGIDYRQSPIPNDYYKLYTKEYLEQY